MLSTERKMRPWWKPSIMTMAILLLPTIAFASGTPAASDSQVAEGHNMTHRMMMLAIQFGVIIIAARFFALLFEKLKMPGVLGELTAGIAIGTYALGGMALPGFPHGIFPGFHGEAVSPELYGLMTIASIVLLFDVGLETDLKMLIRYSVAGSLVGIGGVAGAFFLGAASTSLFAHKFGLVDHQLALFHPTCMFMGIASTATSVGITARILSEKRKLDSPEGVTILSAAVIDDVLGIIILAVVGGVVSAQKAGGEVNLTGIGIIGAKAIGVWLVSTVIGIIASHKISFLLKWFGDRSTIANMAFAIALIVAGLFEEAKLAMIIGAYVMGLSLSQTDISHVIREKLHSIYALLVPVFFCVTGMMIDLGAMKDPNVLMFGAIYTALALVAKIVGCGLPALLANFNVRGALRVGVGMAPRGEVGLIIAVIGMSMGKEVLDERMFAAVIIMVVINTVLAPPALVGLFRNPARGTRKAESHEEQEKVLQFEFPSIEMVEFFVGKLTSVFENEGFFVHLLNREKRLYQLRKANDVIEIQHAGTTLKIMCPEEETHLVHAAMYEALAALEHTLKGLRKPLDNINLHEAMQAYTGQENPHAKEMRQYLKPAYILHSMRSTTKADCIDELIDLLIATGQLPPSAHDQALQAVLEREESMSTGLQYGVAIPHGRTDAVDRLVCAIGVHHQGVDFDSIDGQPTKIMILTLSPENKPAPHIQFMSTISNLLNEQGRQQILAARSKVGIYQILTGMTGPKSAEAEPTKPTRFQLADHLNPATMTTHLKGSTPDEIIRELLDLLEKQGLLKDAGDAAATVLNRENQMSTGMEKGLAIPHGRTNAVDQLVCAIGVKPEGVDFGSADGLPTQIIVLVLTPESGATPYLQFVASLMGLFDGPVREKALTATNSKELREILATEQ